MQIAFLIILFVLGACLGSFLCCQARRLRLKTSKPTRGQTKPKLGPRSVCLACNYRLKWYDNIPLISWLILRGKCRKCHQKIGLAELLSELCLGFAFLLLGLGSFSPFGLGGSLPSSFAAPLSGTLAIQPLMLIGFILVLIFVSLLAFLAIYDGLYGQLPTLFLTFSIICAIMIVILREWASFSSFSNLASNLLNIFFAAAILSGLYLLLYLVSRGKWVGNGDWILALALALALGTPWLALLTLFLANFLACLIMLPSAKKRQNHKIHLGPFLVAAFIIIFAFSDFFSNLINF